MVVSAGVAAQYGHVYCGVVAGCSSVVSKNVLEDSLRTESWLAVALGACIDRGFGEDVRMSVDGSAGGRRSIRDAGAELLP